MTDQAPTPRSDAPLARRLVPALLATLLLAAGLVAGACGGSAETTEEPAAAEAPTAAAEAGDGVAYEPAFPEEVSGEGLSEEDAAVQEGATHSHGGEAHSHEGADSHEEMAEDHEHRDGEGDDHGHSH